MNKFYDLIGRTDWFVKPQPRRPLFDSELFFWMYHQNGRKTGDAESQVKLSGFCWINDEFSQILRCSTEYQLFEAKLRFGEVYTRYVVTEQQEDISQFISTDTLRLK